MAVIIGHLKKGEWHKPKNSPFSYFLFWVGHVKCTAIMKQAKIITGLPDGTLIHVIGPLHKDLSGHCCAISSVEGADTPINRSNIPNKNDGQSEAPGLPS